MPVYNTPENRSFEYDACVQEYGPRGPYNGSQNPVTSGNIDIVERWVKSCGASSTTIYNDMSRRWIHDGFKAVRNKYVNFLAICWRDTTNRAIDKAINDFPFSGDKPVTNTPFKPQSLDSAMDALLVEPEPESAPAPVQTIDISDIVERVFKAVMADDRTVTHTHVKILDQTMRRLITEHAKPQALNLLINNVPEYTVPATHHTTLPILLRTVSANVPAALVGPAGSGKTTACEQTAHALSLQFYMQGAVSGSHEFLGFKDARGEYHGTPFRQAFEHGGLFLADEIDGSDPAALLVINSAVANSFMNFPDQAAPIRRHADFRIVAAANTYWTGGDRVYVGRSQLDGATLDRFAMIEWAYDEKLERELTLGNRQWTVYVQKVRGAVKQLGLRHIVSPRASINGGKLLAAGEQRSYVERMVLFKGLSEEDTKRILDKVKQV